MKTEWVECVQCGRTGGKAAKKAYTGEWQGGGTQRKRGSVSRSKPALSVLVFVLTAVWVPAAYAAFYSGGSGTSTDPYLISSKANLLTLSATSLDWDRCFKMTADVDMAGVTTFSPIGKLETLTFFTGVFDGDGHVIRNLTIDNSLVYGGVFGAVYGGTVCNLGVANLSVSSVASQYVGGLVGNLTGTVLSCYVTGTVTGAGFVGGLVGGVSGGTITSSYTAANMIGTAGYAGGLAGSVSLDAIVTACYSAGSVSGTGVTGGFAGSRAGIISSSFWDTEASGHLVSAGGTGLPTARMKNICVFQNAGWSGYPWVMAEGEYPHLSWEGTGASAIPAAEDIPLAGAGTLTEPYLISTTSDLALLSCYPGVLNAYLRLEADLDCQGVILYPIGNASTPFTGVFDGGGHTLSHVAIAQSGIDNVGLLGYVSGVTAAVKNLGMAGASISGNEHTGAIVGYLASGTIEACYVSGTVTGASSCTGGLVGRTGSGVISACYTMAAVTGTQYVGGMAGRLELGTVVSACYSTGTVSGTSSMGGLAGASSGVVLLSFWDTVTSGITDSAGGEGATTAEMHTIATFQNAGWGAFPWVMEAGAYPRLDWEESGAGSIPSVFIPFSGSGSEADPYRITTAEELAQLRSYPAVWSTHILLTADLDCSGLALEPIGNILAPFTGVFDGGGHVLKHVAINQPDSLYVGLFGQVSGSSAVIKDLGVEWATISGGMFVGAIAGQNCYGSLTGCHAAATVQGTSYAGGLVGYNTGTLTACSAAGPVTTSGGKAGGLIGRNVGGTVLQCYATGSVTGREDGVGGLVGSNYSGTLTHCYATGAVTGRDHVGGLVGIVGAFDDLDILLTLSSTITSCYAIGPVRGRDGVAGLVGSGAGALTAGACYAAGPVTGKIQVGGLIGMGLRFGSIGDATVTGCFWDMTTGGPDNGFGTGLSSESMKQPAAFVAAGWDFTTPEWSMADGISYPQLEELPIPIGSIESLQMIGSMPARAYFLTGDLNAIATAAWNAKAGQPGFEPLCSPANPFMGTLDGCGHRIYGLHISRPSVDDVGLFACIGGSGEVKRLCLDDVDITGNDRVGTVAGVNGGTIHQCCALGSVVGTGAAGGLAAENSGVVAESYAAVGLSGSTVGGLVAAPGTGTVTSSFWDTQVSGTAVSGGGTGLATMSMRVSTPFSAAGWDMMDTWAVTEGYTYPYFMHSAQFRVVTEPPRLINATAVSIVVDAFVARVFVSINGGEQNYPLYHLCATEGEQAISIPLKQDSVNNIIVSSLSTTGEEIGVAKYAVCESNAFPSGPVSVTALTISPASASLADGILGGEQPFHCEATFADSTSADVTSVASWVVNGMGFITPGGWYTHFFGTVLVQGLLYTQDGCICSNAATVTTAKALPEKDATQGRVQGTVRSTYTGLGLEEAEVTAYDAFSSSTEAQYAVYDSLGNYSFAIDTGAYTFEGACPEYRSETDSGSVSSTMPVEHDFELRPNDAQAPWVVFVEPAEEAKTGGATVNTAQFVVTAINTDKYSELAVATFTLNSVDHDILGKISSTGFYRGTWTLDEGLNTMRLYAEDSEGNALEKSVAVTYDPAYEGSDGDGDGLPDSWETTHGLDPNSGEDVNGAGGDLDGDGLTNQEEYQAGTLPNLADSDGDGLSDGWELAQGLRPLSADSDGDGITDYDEAGYDGDYETYNPYDPDTNPTGTDLDALAADTDRDGISDQAELLSGSNPLDALNGAELPLRGGLPVLLALLLACGACYGKRQTTGGRRKRNS